MGFFVEDRCQETVFVVIAPAGMLHQEGIVLSAEEPRQLIPSWRIQLLETLQQPGTHRR